VRTTSYIFQETQNRDIDILFMIDDSLSMAPLLDKLAANFPAFINVFQTLPTGLPWGSPRCSRASRTWARAGADSSIRSSRWCARSARTRPSRSRTRTPASCARTRTSPSSWSPTRTTTPRACVSAEEEGLLIPVHTMVSELQALKADPRQIFVAAIAGPPDPYDVIMVPAAPGTMDAQNGIQWPNIAHSCMENSGEYGDPGVRLAELVEAFGRNGVFESICADSFAPALIAIAQTIGKVLGPKCVQGQLVDEDGDPSNGLQPDCSVVEHSYDAQGNVTDTVIPSCDDAPGAPKCFKLADDPANCPSTPAAPEKVLTFVPPPDPTVSNLNASVSCVVCVAGVSTPGCP